MKVKLRGLVLGSLLIAATGCATEDTVEEEEISEGGQVATEAGETPYWGCWQYSGWSANTSGNGTTVCRSESASQGGRRHCVTDRSAQHPYSVRVFNDWINGPSCASQWHVYISCGPGSGSLSVGYKCAVGEEFPGCGDPYRINYAKIEVRAANCG
jgi:hypothetical protein